MAQAFPSSARSKSSEKSSSFFFAIAPSGIAGSFGASAAKVVAGDDAGEGEEASGHGSVVVD
jgi:hypothetical protein